MQKSRKNLSRREREKLSHRNEIIEAAERVFAKKGLESATVEDVAQEAEFSVGTIYNFFENKDALYGEVMLKIVEEFHAAFLAVIADAGDPLSAIRAVVRLRLSAMDKHGSFFRQILEARPMSQMSPRHAIPENCRKRYDEHLEKTAGLFKKAIAKGQVRKMDPFYAALTLAGSVNAYWAYWSESETCLTVDERVELVYRNCLEMMLEE